MIVRFMPLADQSQGLRSLVTLPWEKVFVYLSVNATTTASTVFSVISQVPGKCELIHSRQTIFHTKS